MNQKGKRKSGKGVNTNIVFLAGHLSDHAAYVDRLIGSKFQDAIRVLLEQLFSCDSLREQFETHLEFAAYESVFEPQGEIEWHYDRFGDTPGGFRHVEPFQAFVRRPNADFMAAERILHMGEGQGCDWVDEAREQLEEIRSAVSTFGLPIVRPNG